MDVPKDRETRLRLLAREQRGRLLAFEMLSRLSEISGQEFATSNLLPLEETDRLFEQYSEAFRRCSAAQEARVHLRVPRAESGALFAWLAGLGRHTRQPAVAVFVAESRYTGAVVMPAPRFLAAAEFLMRLQGDELRAASMDGSHGLLIDYAEREDEIELWCWGDDWTQSPPPDV